MALPKAPCGTHLRARRARRRGGCGKRAPSFVGLARLDGIDRRRQPGAARSLHWVLQAVCNEPRGTRSRHRRSGGSSQCSARSRRGSARVAHRQLERAGSKARVAAFKIATQSTVASDTVNSRGSVKESSACRLLPSQFATCNGDGSFNLLTSIPWLGHVETTSRRSCCNSNCCTCRLHATKHVQCACRIRLARVDHSRLWREQPAASGCVRAS